MSKETRISRRRLLKAMAAAGGAVAASSVLPKDWDKPLVEGGALPAHAQTSPVLGTGDFQATLTWDEGDPNAEPFGEGAVDVDLHVIEPDGTHVYFGNQTGPTATLDVDDLVAFGPENIFVPAGNAATGTYQVFVVYYSGGVATTATITIKVFADTPDEHTMVFTRELTDPDSFTGFNVADVTFPSGTITETSGTRPLAAEAASK